MKTEYELAVTAFARCAMSVFCMGLNIDEAIDHARKMATEMDSATIADGEIEFLEMLT